MLRIGIKGIHALLWEMVFRQDGTSSRCASLATSHAGSKATPHPARAKLISAVALSAENRGALAIAKSTSVC
jgi:hypothetical protein